MPPLPETVSVRNSSPSAPGRAPHSSNTSILLVDELRAHKGHLRCCTSDVELGAREEHQVPVLERRRLRDLQGDTQRAVGVRDLGGEMHPHPPAACCSHRKRAVSYLPHQLDATHPHPPLAAVTASAQPPLSLHQQRAMAPSLSILLLSPGAPTSLRLQPLPAQPHPSPNSLPPGITACHQVAQRPHQPAVDVHEGAAKAAAAQQPPQSHPFPNSLPPGTTACHQVALRPHQPVVDVHEGAAKAAAAQQPHPSLNSLPPGTTACHQAALRPHQPVVDVHEGAAKSAVAQQPAGVLPARQAHCAGPHIHILRLLARDALQGWRGGWACECVRVRVCVRACVSVCMRLRARVCMRLRAHVCMRARTRVCVKRWSGNQRWRAKY